MVHSHILLAIEHRVACYASTHVHHIFTPLRAFVSPSYILFHTDFACILRYSYRPGVTRSLIQFVMVIGSVPTSSFGRRGGGCVSRSPRIEHRRNIRKLSHKVEAQHAATPSGNEQTSLSPYTKRSKLRCGRAGLFMSTWRAEI